MNPMNVIRLGAIQYGKNYQKEIYESYFMTELKLLKCLIYIDTIVPKRMHDSST